MIHMQSLEAILSRMFGKMTLALGDIMLDRYQIGKAVGLSQEAAVTVVRIDEENFFPGGAGNAAACEVAAGLITHLVGVLGTSGDADLRYDRVLDRVFREAGILAHFITDQSRKTTVKTRVLGRQSTEQHLCRIDRESLFPLNQAIEAETIQLILRLDSEISPEAITVHDYRKGFLTPNIFRIITEISAKKNIPVFADMKPESFLKYGNLIRNRKLFYLKQNWEEAARTAAILGGFERETNDNQEVKLAAKIIQGQDTRINLAITRGEQGAAIFGHDGNSFILPPHEVKSLLNVAGAGDTVVAYLASAFLGRATLVEALNIAIAAAQIAIGKNHTSVVSRYELLDWFTSRKTGGREP